MTMLYVILFIAAIAADNTYAHDQQVSSKIELMQQHGVDPQDLYTDIAACNGELDESISALEAVLKRSNFVERG